MVKDLKSEIFWLVYLLYVAVYCSFFGYSAFSHVLLLSFAKNYADFHLSTGWEVNKCGPLMSR
jgi:hypothetical protein